jgi:hypothetical protein
MSPQEFINAINKCNEVNNLTFARCLILTQMPHQMCFLLAGGYQSMRFCLSARHTKGKPPSVSNCGDLMTRNVSERSIYVISRFRAA